MNDQIKAEARQRLILEEATSKAEKDSIHQKEELKRKETEERIHAERINLLAEEEQVRIKARRLAVEAEAKHLANEKEAAIAAEVERLRNRTKVEVLEDTVAELSAQLAELKSTITKSHEDKENDKSHFILSEIQELRDTMKEYKKSNNVMAEIQVLREKMRSIVKYEKDYSDFIEMMYQRAQRPPCIHMSVDEYNKNYTRERPTLPTL